MNANIPTDVGHCQLSLVAVRGSAIHLTPGEADRSYCLSTGIAARNEAKAKLLYGYIDGQDFYTNPVAKEDRSRMNVPFRLRDDSLDAAFLAEAEARGLSQLKGHRSVGGMRASIYNAMPLEGVEALLGTPPGKKTWVVRIPRGSHLLDVSAPTLIVHGVGAKIDERFVNVELAAIPLSRFTRALLTATGYLPAP